MGGWDPRRTEIIQRLLAEGRSVAVIHRQTGASRRKIRSIRNGHDGGEGRALTTVRASGSASEGAYPTSAESDAVLQFPPHDSEVVNVPNAAQRAQVSWARAREEAEIARLGAQVQRIHAKVEHLLHKLEGGELILVVDDDPLKDKVLLLANDPD